MISLNKCTGNFNIFPPKICFKRNKTYVKALNMLKTNEEVKAMTEHISCDCKCKFNSTKCNSIQNGIIRHVIVNGKSIVSVKKITVRVRLQLVICENSKYLKSIE